MAGTTRWLRRAAAALVLTIGVWTLVPSSIRAADTPEVRALWVLRSTLASPESIATLVESARAHGFNTLFVQVRGRADAYYQSRLEPRAAELARQPDTFDPLRTVLDEAHRAGLRVHAWMNLNLVSSAAELPIARDHLVYRHPEWLMVPRPIAQTLAKVEPDSPAYAGMIARWTR
ncbi:MAG TPA: family 10 glycosylhydrolase, partial [Gemmatimonadaceae bacterium]